MTLYKGRVIIVGAGIGGLSAAIHLAARGYQVQVFERQPQVGGKLNHITINGFSFDTGPSLITMPHVLHDLFRAAGRDLHDYLDLIPLDITCRYFYHDGVTLNAWRDLERLAAEFARLNPTDGAALSRFIHYACAIYQAAADPFLYHSMDSLLEVTRTLVRYVLQGHPASERALEDEYILLKRDEAMEDETALTRLQAVLSALSPATLHDRVRDFFQDQHLRQLYDRYATYNGSSPYQLAAVYSIIPYVELAGGGWYPRGGIYKLAQALERLARELGVCIQTGCDVRRIVVERGEARGVVLADGRVLRGDIVIANSDVVTTHRDLLSPAVRPPRSLRRLEHLEPSCSGFVLLLGVDKQYPQLEHHNIFFSEDYPAEFDDLFKHRVPLHNPTIYVCVTTRTDATQAPPSHENLFILVNAPYLTAQSDWRRDGPAYRNLILDLLVSYPQVNLSDLREHIVCEAMITPEDFYRSYGANAGSIYGLSSNPRMAPFTRPGNLSPDIRNLYFVGGSTHPGGGVPLVMLSGKIVADMIAE